MYPYEVKVPKPPYDWFDPAPNTSKGGHTFDKVYNPGTWSSFYYLPEFLSRSQGGQYKFHCLPDGCQPVLPNEYDSFIFTHSGWVFFYQRWKKGEDEDGVRCNIDEYILLHGLMCKIIFLLGLGNDALVRRYCRS